jgi:hypothetical protein
MNLCADLLTSAKSRLRPQTKTVVTDKKLNQYEEVLQPDGTYLRKPLGNKKEQLSADEKAYFIDKQLASIWEDRLYLSNADVAKDREQLLKSGITHIVNLATGVGELFPNVYTHLTSL